MHAVVMRKPGAPVTGDEIIAFCKERIAHYKCPRSVRVQDETAAAVRRRQDPEARIAQAVLGTQGTPDRLIDRRLWH